MGNCAQHMKNTIYYASRLTPGSKQLDVKSWLPVLRKSTGKCAQHTKNTIYYASRLTPGSKQLDVKSWFPVWPKSTEKCAQHTQNTIYYACRLTPDSKQLNVKSWLPVLPKSTGKCAQHAKKYNIWCISIDSWQQATGVLTSALPKSMGSVLNIRKIQYIKHLGGFLAGGL